MGEVIDFKAEKDGTHLRPPPEGSAKIVFFTGVWHEPMNAGAGKRDAHRSPTWKAAWCRTAFAATPGRSRSGPNEAIAGYRWDADGSE